MLLAASTVVHAGEPPRIFAPQFSVYAGHEFSQPLIVQDESPETLDVSLGAGAPSWLRISAGSFPEERLLGGRPPADASGNYAFELSARDNEGLTTTLPTRILVTEHRFIPAIQAQGRLVVGTRTFFSFLIEDSAPFTYSLAQGTLPPGLSLEPHGGLGGTPTQAGEYPVTILATDSAGHTSRWQDRLIVHGAELVARDDAIELLSRQLPLTFDLAANDDGDFDTVEWLDAPPSGLSVTPMPDPWRPGAITAQALPGFTGEVSLRYQLASWEGERSNVATLRVRVIDGTAHTPSRTLDAVAGTPIRIDLAEGATGGPFTDARLVLPDTSAGTGELIRETQGGETRLFLVFTPRLAFSGTIQIRFSLRAGTGWSYGNWATLTLRVVRPDPSRDAEVIGLVAAQADTARRFSRAQLDNFGQRLEQLHNGQVRDHNGLRFQARGAAPSCARVSPTDPDCTALPDEPDEPDASEEVSSERGFGLWSAGSLAAGGPGGSGNAHGFDVHSDGLSAGVDRAMDDRWILGLGVGWARDRTDVGRNESRSRADAHTGAVYASFSPRSGWYVDGILGHQWLSFDLQRYSSLDAQRYRATRKGAQWFASLSAGTVFDLGGLRWNAYTKAEMANATLDDYRESGELGLAFGEMKVDSRTLRLGLRTQYEHSWLGGRLVPTARLEYLRSWDANDDAWVAYASLPATRYRLSLPDRSEGGWLVGLGAWWYAPKGGWSVGLEGRHGDQGPAFARQQWMISVQKQQ